MEPDFRTDDLAAVAPADCYSGHGIYVLDHGHGHGHGPARHRAPMGEFNRSVVGKVFAAVKMLDRPLLRQLVAERSS
jgi:hypothetical protein